MPLRCGDALKRRSIYKHGEYGSGAPMHGFLHAPLHRYVTGCGVYLFLQGRYLLACTFIRQRTWNATFLSRMPSRALCVIARFPSEARGLF
jgi:hypothetical protein